MDKVFPGPFIQSPGSMYWPLFLNLQLCRSSGVAPLLFSNTVHGFFFFFSFLCSVIFTLHLRDLAHSAESSVLLSYILWFHDSFHGFLFLFLSLLRRKSQWVKGKKYRKEGNKGKEPTYNSGLELQWKKTSSMPMGRSCILANPSY